MDSIRFLYRTGHGPSSSHTMGPRRAAEQFQQRCQAGKYRVTLFGSLAATGKGHMTDRAILEVLGADRTEIVWCDERTLPLHPNGMRFEGLEDNGNLADSWEVYSIGGGALIDAMNPSEPKTVYPFNSMKEILEKADREGKPLWAFVEECEGEDIWSYLDEIWQVMKVSINTGLQAEGNLPGGLQLNRKAAAYFAQAQNSKGYLETTGKIFAYALAVSEENAALGSVVTAPTCGACGVLPAVLRYLQEERELPEVMILRALATAGLVGNLVKHNASISGAEVGCQGEVGTACAMAAAAVTQLLGGTPHQIEYAAEMGMEHHLGLTCDPIDGLVQIPCIERNAIAAVRALNCASYVLLSDGRHRVSLDEVIETMRQTGLDMAPEYRETSCGGLALIHDRHR